MAAPTSSDRLRLFQRAVRENITLEEARRRTAEERWQASQRRLADRRCGTRADPEQEPVQRPRMWWQDRD